MPRNKNNHYTQGCTVEHFANGFKLYTPAKPRNEIKVVNAYGSIDIKQAPKIKIGNPTPPDSPILEQAKKDS